MSAPIAGSGGVLAPRYLSAVTGQLGDDPLQLAGDAPTVDTATLARLFTGPALGGEFTQGAFWQGVRLGWPLPDPCPASGNLAAVLAGAVANLCAGAETVGVKLSGGLDSLAVLCAVAELHPTRRLVAYCVDLTDDQGIRCVDVVRGLLKRTRAATGTAVELVVVDPAERTGPLGLVAAWPAVGCAACG